MTLVPNRSSFALWSPEAMPTPRSLLDRLFEEVAGPGPSNARIPLDMTETESHLLIDLALPGVRPDDLDLQAEGRTLAIRGRYAPAGSEGRNVWVRSLPRGDFHFTLTLPVKVETDNVNATLDAGMLHLELPKVAEARTRKIEVRQVQNTAMKAIS